MLRGTDNFYFILITFSSKLELVLINVGFHMTSIRKSEYQGDIASKMKQLCYLIRTSHLSRSLGGKGYFLRWNRRGEFEH